MKRKSLLFLLLFALMAPWAAQAQETVEIGDPNSSTTQYTVPVNMFYHYSLTQQIYTADEIGMAGNITSIAFEYTNTSSFSMNDVQVYMMNVDKDNFESTTDMVALSDAELVWEGTFTADGAGWVTLDFDNPFGVLLRPHQRLSGQCLQVPHYLNDHGLSKQLPRHRLLQRLLCPEFERCNHLQWQQDPLPVPRQHPA